MKRRVIIHSFHSQVYQTLSRLDYEPDVIVALDSHLDVHIGVKEILDLMPKDIQLAALRASSHTMIRRVVGDLPMLLKAQGLPTESIPEMFLVVPQVSINRYVFDQTEMLKEAILSGAVPADRFKKPEQVFLNSLSNVWGIKVIASPPKNLLKLLDDLRGIDYALFDLDVDYLLELQDECYTPLKNAQPSDLGWMERVLKLIRKIKPFIITVSEAKVSAIRRPKSNFSKLILKLRNLGYSIDYKRIFTSDEKAERSLRIYQKFHEEVQKPLQKRQFVQPNFLNTEAFEKSIEELREATKRYFKSHTQKSGK